MVEQNDEEGNANIEHGGIVGGCSHRIETGSALD